MLNKPVQNSPQHQNISSTVREVIASNSAPIASHSGFNKATMFLYPASFVFRRLQGLHRRALSAPDLVRGQHHYPPAKAKNAYHRALSCAIATYMVLSPEKRREFFAQFLSFINTSHSLDGVESLFLAGISTMGAVKNLQLFNQGVALWDRLGPPRAIGGGAGSVPIFDSTRNAFVFIDGKTLASLARAGVHNNLVHDINQPLAGSLQQMGLLDAAAAQDGTDGCTYYWQIGGAVAGGIVGAVGTKTAAGTISGMSAGAGLGALIGKSEYGQDICGWFTPDSPQDGAGGASSAEIPGDSTMESSPEQNQSTDNSSSQSSSEQNQSTDNSGSQSSSEQNQSTDNSGSQSSSEQNHSTDNSSNQSSPEQNQSTDNPGSSGDGSSGLPNPDDPGGLPDPDDPRGFQLSTATFASQSTAAAFVKHQGGVVVLSGVPQLAIDGKSLAVTGFLNSMAPIQQQINLPAGSAFNIVGTSQSASTVKAVTQMIGIKQE